MKKSKTMFGKIIIVIIMIFIILAFNGEFTSTMSASSDGDIRTTNSRKQWIEKGISKINRKTSGNGNHDKKNPWIW